MCCGHVIGVGGVACRKPRAAAVTNSSSLFLQKHCFGDCPNGWRRFQDTCYTLIPMPADSSDIYRLREHCIKAGGDLVSLLSDIHVEFIRNMIHAANFNPNILYIYTSVNALSSDGMFRHMNGTVFNSSVISATPATVTDGRCTVLTSSDWLPSNLQLLSVPCCEEANITQHLLCEREMSGYVSYQGTENDVFAKECYANVSECSADTCQHGGTCVDRLVNFTCLCEMGYEGRRCEINIDDCANSPCQNQGACADGVAAFTCQCQPGFTGQTCATDIDECKTESCTNGGTCVNEHGSFRCDCVDPFIGKRCENSGSCSNVPAVAHASLVSKNGTSVSASAVFSCIQTGDFRFNLTQRTEVLTCATPGGWQQTSLSQRGCELYCPDLLATPHAFPDTSSVSVGNHVNVTCRRNYVLPTGGAVQQLECDVNGQWDKAITDCQIIRCPAISYSSHRSIDSAQTQYRSVVVAQCDLGYTFPDGTRSRSIRCLGNGKWSNDPPECKIARCPGLGSLHHVTCDSQSDVYASIVTCQCRGGMRMLDGSIKKVTKCTARGEWTRPVTDCTANRCYPLPYVKLASPKGSINATYGSDVTMSCKEGYVFPENKLEEINTTCQTDGHWKPLLKKCIPLLCNPIPPASFVSLSTKKRLYKTVVNATCDIGYRFPDNNTLTSLECRRNQMWNDTLYNCSIVYCPSAPPVVNCSVTGANTFYNSTYHYACNEGYRFLDGFTSRTIRCTEHGVWNETEFNCKFERCGPVQSVPFATPHTTNTSWWTTVEMNCLPGYRYKDNSSVTLTTCVPSAVSDATWNVTIRPCYPLSCSDLPDVPNATVDSRDVIFPAVRNYSCITGHEYPDGSKWKVTQCSATAVWVDWNVRPSPCQSLHCPLPNDVINTTRDSNNTEYLSSVNYTCFDGYEFIGLATVTSQVITCTANATWDDQLSPCKPVICPRLPTWADAIFNSTEREYLTQISYYCAPNFIFKDKKVGNKTAVCAAGMYWSPAIVECVDKQSISAEFRGRTWEAAEAVPIGTVCIALLVLVVSFLVLIDLNKLVSDVKVMRRNLRHAWMRMRKPDRNKSASISPIMADAL